MKVADVMNKGVQTTGPDGLVHDAAQKMNKYSIGSLVVVSGGKLAGIITERDILKRLASTDGDMRKTKVNEVMTKNVVMIEPDADLEEAIDAMNEYKIKKLPVVSQGKLIGIITASDVCTAQPKMIAALADLMAVPGKQKPMAG